MRVPTNLVLFNYLDRPIYEVFIDGEAGESSSAYPATGGGTISGVKLKLGPKRVTWRLGGPPGMPRNGQQIEAINEVVLDGVPPDAVYLGVHIYPDYTVELLPSRHYPKRTEKGVAMAATAAR